MTSREDQVRALLQGAAGDVDATADPAALYVRARGARRHALAVRASAAVAVIAAVAVGGAIFRAEHNGDSRGTLAVGTGTASPSPSTSLTQSPPSTAPQNPTLLAGTWTVALNGQPAGTITFTPELRVSLPCGDEVGEWSADSAGLLAVGVGPGCATPSGELRWLTSVARYEIAGTRARLLAADGSVEAELERTSAAQRADIAFATAAPLPAGVPPARQSDVAGQWRAPGHSASATLTIDQDGVWRVTGTCNKYGGRLVVGPGGDLVVASGGSTLALCRGEEIAAWIVMARRVGASSAGGLVLYDGSGKRLGTITRA